MTEFVLPPPPRNETANGSTEWSMSGLLDASRLWLTREERGFVAAIEVTNWREVKEFRELDEKVRAATQLDVHGTASVESFAALSACNEYAQMLGERYSARFEEEFRRQDPNYQSKNSAPPSEDVIVPPTQAEEAATAGQGQSGQ